MSAHLCFQVIDPGAERRDEFGQLPNQVRGADARVGLVSGLAVAHAV